MDLNTFWGNFEVIAEAPGGVQRLRELILNMAYSGRIEQPDQRDIDDTEFWYQAIAEREVLLQTLKFRHPNNLKAEVQESEQLFDIPAHWVWLRIGHVFPISSGTTPSRNKPEYFVDATESWVKTTDLNNALVLSCEEKITSQAVVDCNLKCYPIGTNCIALYGGAGTIGKSGVLGIETTINQSVCAIYPNKYIDPFYLHGYLKLIRPLWMQFAASLRKAPNINAGIVNNMAFPLPPLAEQRRIVAKVDELMALCDRYEVLKCDRNTLRTKMRASAIDALMNAETDESLNTAWEFVREHWKCLNQQPEDVDDARNTLIGLAMRGKVVPQHGTDQAASQLLDQIQIEKTRLLKEKKIPKPKKLFPLNAKDFPYPVPQNWIWTRLGKIAKTVEYGTSAKASAAIDEVPVFRMNNIQNGKLIFDGFKYVASSIKDLPRLYLQDGDLLFNRTNSYELVGKTGLFRSEINSYTFASYLIRVVLLQDYIYPEFINLALNSPYFRRTQIEPEIVQQCGQANFNGTKLQNTLLPIPPLAEQKRIVAKIDQLMALCDTLETHLHETQEKARALAAAVVGQLEV